MGKFLGWVWAEGAAPIQSLRIAEPSLPLPLLREAGKENARSRRFSARSW
jgi:hypothetical protein